MGERCRRIRVEIVIALSILSRKGFLSLWRRVIRDKKALVGHNTEVQGEAWLKARMKRPCSITQQREAWPQPLARLDPGPWRGLARALDQASFAI